MATDNQDTPERILVAAREVLVAEGYDAFSMAAVAAAFDGSQSLIHYHFDTREGLIAALIERERERYVEWFETFPEDPAARFDRLLDEFVREFDAWADENAMATRLVELAAAATESPPIRAALRELQALVRTEFERAVADGVEAGVFDADADPDAVARLAKAGHDSVTERWLLDEPAELDAVAETVEETLLARLGTDRARLARDRGDPP